MVINHPITIEQLSKTFEQYFMLYFFTCCGELNQLAFAFWNLDFAKRGYDFIINTLEQGI